MKTQNYLCVDLKTQMKKKDLEVLDGRRGTLVRTAEDKFTFTERGALPHEVHEELHWHLIDRSKYGKLTANANHVKLELYVPHEAYTDGCDLADILASQTELLGEMLCETNMPKLVEHIKGLKKEPKRAKRKTLTTNP